jgi:hypothetical protein
MPLLQQPFLPILASAYHRPSDDDQTVSSLMASASIAFSVANRNVAENVPRLILFAMLASVSFNPCSASRSELGQHPGAGA